MLRLGQAVPAAKPKGGKPDLRRGCPATAAAKAAAKTPPGSKRPGEVLDPRSCPEKKGAKIEAKRAAAEVEEEVEEDEEVDDEKAEGEEAQEEGGEEEEQKEPDEEVDADEAEAEEEEEEVGAADDDDEEEQFRRETGQIILSRSAEKKKATANIMPSPSASKDETPQDSELQQHAQGFEDEVVVTPAKTARRTGWGEDTDDDADDEDPEQAIRSSKADTLPSQVARACAAAPAGCKVTTLSVDLWECRKGKAVGLFCKLHAQIAEAYLCDGYSEQLVAEKIREPTIMQEFRIAERILAKMRQPPWAPAEVRQETMVGLKIFAEVAVVYDGDWLKQTGVSMDLIENLPVARGQVPLNGDLKSLSSMVVLDASDSANFPTALRWHRAELFSVVQNCLIETKMERQQQLRAKQAKQTFHKISVDTPRSKPLSSTSLSQQLKWEDVAKLVGEHQAKLKKRLEDEGKQAEGLRGEGVPTDSSDDDEKVYSTKTLKASTVGLEDSPKRQKKHRGEDRKVPRTQRRSLSVASTPVKTPHKTGDGINIDLGDTPKSLKGESSWQAIDVQKILDGEVDIGKSLNGIVIII